MQDAELREWCRAMNAAGVIAFQEEARPLSLHLSLALTDRDPNC